MSEPNTELIEYIKTQMEKAYERGWHDHLYSTRIKPEPMDLLKSDTERAIDAGIKQPDYLARMYSKEQCSKS